MTQDEPTQQVTEFPIDIAPEALLRIRRVIERANETSSFLRIGLKGGGCSGLEYVIKLDDRHTPFDIEKDFDGIKVVCDRKSAVHLQGSRLVYTGNLIGGGFAFENPNAGRSCGCGSSFMPK